MLHRQEHTPCPQSNVVANPPCRRTRDSTFSVGGESTANIEFTTDVRPSLTNVAPRRMPKRRTNAITFSIHEDEVVKDYRRSTNQVAAPPRRTSILSQPAQRMNHRTSLARSDIQHAPARDVQLQPTRPVSQNAAPTRSVTKPDTRRTSALGISDGLEKSIKKPARRGTLYIPSEDTTMPSVFMGVFSPIKEAQNVENTKQVVRLKNVDLTGIAAQMAHKKARRVSLAGVPPKRAPLHAPLRAIQETTIMNDVHGEQTGKENVPPGWENKEKEVKEESDLFDLSKPTKPQQPPPVSTHMRRRSFMPAEERKSMVMTVSGNQVVRKSRTSILPNTKFDTRKSVGHRSINSSPRTLIESNKPMLIKKPAEEAWKPAVSHKVTMKASAYKPLPETVTEKPAPRKMLLPKVTVSESCQQYPLIQENILDASMYEDGWLAHQEVAITQLVNNLFSSARSSDDHADGYSLMVSALQLYQDPAISLLQKRLQAALLYGALSIPKDVLAKGSRIVDDLGLRRNFLDLWTTTYDLKFLKAVSEVIVGRQCLKTSSKSPVSPRGSPTGKAKARKALKHSVEKFLEAFLLRNEDGRNDGTEGWSYRRTVLRSLLLILLLDKARTSPGSAFETRLFQCNSVHKSSQSVLEALAKLLLPFAGDVTRPLRNLSYSVTHTQYPLEEYEYGIENIAVDLRDGVRLTRLVEILLYPSAAQLLETTTDGGETTTIAMPTGELLSLVDGEQEWPLSQHIKLPCIGRATKLYNVQVALSALSGIKGMAAVTADIKAEDIVDGFREKTVALLWALVSRWGLAGLIDWSDVQGEIRRLRRGTYADVDDEIELEEEMDGLPESIADQKMLLKRWSAAVASKVGLRVSNLTTSFADGKVFGAIIDEYRPYLLPCEEGSSPPKRGLSLGQKLISVGCSLQFAKIFTDTITSQVFDRDFTLASLAFLCSRLLSASRRPRAAVAIQRKYRQILQQRTLQRQGVKARIARECVVVVETRERLLWAKETILRFWRKKRLNLPREDDDKKHGMTIQGKGREESLGDESDLWLNL